MEGNTAAPVKYDMEVVRWFTIAAAIYAVIGTLVGVILMQGLTTTVLNTGFDYNLTLVLKAGVVIAVCLLQAPKFRKLVGLSGKSA